MAMGSYNGFSGAQREAVQRILNEKWATGEWPRPAECIACGQTEGAIHGHHEDYSRPRSYVELCVTCHLLLHCRFRNPEVWAAYRMRVRAGWRSEPLTQRGAFYALQRGILRDVWPVGSMHEPRGETFLDSLGMARIG